MKNRHGVNQVVHERYDTDYTILCMNVRHNIVHANCELNIVQ